MRCAKNVFSCVQSNDLGHFTRLLEAGEHVDQVDDNCTPILVWACFYGRNIMVEKLIARGANVNVSRSINWDTPLHAASQGGYSDIVTQLVNAGANINAVNVHKFTPLHLAFINRNHEIALRLLNAGADVNACDFGGATPLHLAARLGTNRLAAKLISLGSNVNKVDATGKTPLITAVVCHRPGIVKQLLSAGANVNCVFQIILHDDFWKRDQQKLLRIIAKMQLCRRLSIAAALKQLDLPVLLVLEITNALVCKNRILFNDIQRWRLAQHVRQFC